MLRFISFGSGSSGNCYYFQAGQTRILIDAGVSYTQLRKFFQSFGLQMRTLNAVLVTHDHADHIKSVGKLAAECGLNIYATELVHEGISRNYCVTPKLTSEKRVFISKDESFNIGDFKITSFHVPHDSTDCVGYRIEVDDIRFCLITDIGHVTERVQEEVREANYLILESNHDREMLMKGPYPAFLKGRIAGENGHLSNTEAGELLANYASPNLHHVWLCHLSEENNHPVLAQKTIDGILRSYGIIPGKDFKIEVLKRRNPSRVYDLRADGVVDPTLPFED
ncbi:MAG: MBL fold metallo-hydrolase [Bacteroidaceae bacterium]|nr:MBL fold metallo-hydrolase [Bacteroidaceae bacterium]